MRFASLLLLSSIALLFNSPAQAVTLEPTTPMENLTDCGNSTERYRVDNFNGHCTRADIRVRVDGIEVQKALLNENEEIDINISQLTGKIWVYAFCGSDQVSKYFFRDIHAPTFAALTVDGARSSWANSPVEIGFERAADDGNYPTGYRMFYRVDGGTNRDVKALRVSLPLSEGEHTVDARLIDSCGHASARSEVTFKVDNRAPTGSFVKPEADQIVPRGGNLFIDIGVGDPGSSPFDQKNVSGLSLATVYLDDIPGEFNNGAQICRFNGPWIIGMHNRKNCTVSTSTWTRGTHRLILVVTDRVHNQTTIQRSIRVD